MKKRGTESWIFGGFLWASFQLSPATVHDDDDIFSTHLSLLFFSFLFFSICPLNAFIQAFKWGQIAKSFLIWRQSIFYVRKKSSMWNDERLMYISLQVEVFRSRDIFPPPRAGDKRRAKDRKRASCTRVTWIKLLKCCFDIYRKHF